MDFSKAIVNIQNNLDAPKGQFNNFGKYNYRSCEDILGAVKPLLAKHDLFLTISDSLEQIGDRYYIKATATISDGTNEKSVTAYAREEESKKGMDGSQVTGASSSYARKYALNGLFAIDDTKDSDCTNNSEPKMPFVPQQNNSQHNGNKPLSEAQVKRLYAIGKSAGYDNSTIQKMINNKHSCNPEQLTKAQYDNICTKLEAKTLN